MRASITYFIVSAFFIYYCVSRSYKNYTLYRVIPVEEKHMNFLTNLSTHFNVIFWNIPVMLYQPVDFVIGPEEKKSFLIEAEKAEVFLNTVIKDLQEVFDLQKVKSYNKGNLESFDWNHYYRLDDIYAWLLDLEKAYPQELQLQSFGKTTEKRELFIARVVLPGSKHRSKVFLEGGIHGREWISPAFVTYMINQVVRAGDSNNVILKTIAETYEWYFIPVLNPDGYEYSHTEDRLWKKNTNNGTYAVDLNGNFGHAFGTVGVSQDMASDIYCGPRVFSEKESRYLANYITQYGVNVEYYFSFHSYGQYMIIPYENMRNHSDNYNDVLDMCQQARLRIAVTSNIQYNSGTLYETIGIVRSGTSGSWVKARFRIPYVVTFYLRDAGAYGYALPTELIIPTCKETMAGLLSMLVPRTPSYNKLRESLDAAERVSISDKIMIVSYLLQLITVRFD